MLKYGLHISHFFYLHQLYLVMEEVGTIFINQQQSGNDTQHIQEPLTLSPTIYYFFKTYNFKQEKKRKKKHKLRHVEAQFSSFDLNNHTLGLPPQNQKLKKALHYKSSFIFFRDNKASKLRKHMHGTRPISFTKVTSNYF